MMTSGHESGPAHDEFARRVAKARHDLRNPVAGILGFSELLIEKARERGYNFLKGRVELVERLGHEMVEHINGCLDPGRIEAGQSDVHGLQRLLRQHAGRIAALTATLNRKPLIRHDAMLRKDIDCVGGDARKLLDLSETALGFLLETAAGDPGLPGEAQTGAAGSVTARAEPAAATLRPLKLLVVDDEPGPRETLRDLLVGAGHAVCLASGGVETLQLAAHQPFDVVLLDLGMPEPDGLQTLQELRSRASLRDVPVLMLAAPEETELAICAVEAGADDYLSKPVSRTLLLARLEASWARRQLRHRARSG